MTISGIYIISSLIPFDKRVYIGQSVNINKRIKNHKISLKKGNHVNKRLQRFYNKYGESMLSFNILELCQNEILNEKEVYWISFYDSLNKGFNLTSGADDNPMNNPENRISVSKALKGHKKSKEWLEKIVLNTDKSKNIKAKIKSGIIKKVYAYDKTTGKILYECYGYREMSRLTSVGESNIRQCCYGHIKTAKGFHFSNHYKTNDKVISDIIYKNKTDEYKKNHSKLFSGEKNPMYGKKRPDISGVNNPAYKRMLNGIKSPKKYNYDEIIKLYKDGNTQKEVAKK